MTSIHLDVAARWEKNSGVSRENAEKLASQQAFLTKVMQLAIPSFSAPSSPCKEEKPLEEVQVVKLPTEEPKKGKLEHVKKGSVDGLLIASHFPIFGLFSANTCKALIAKEIKQTTDSEKLATLIKKDNQYRIASISSTLITLALAVTALAVGIITGGIALFIGLAAIAAVTLAATPITVYDSILLYRNTHKATPEEVKV